MLVEKGFFNKKKPLDSYRERGVCSYEQKLFFKEMDMSHKIIAYYYYGVIENPKQEVKKHKKFLEELDARARIYIANNGINAQMSIASDDAKTYLDWLTSDPRFGEIMFKIDPYHEHVFPRLAVKAREQLVALDLMPDLKNGGEHVEPKRWKQMLDERDENTLVLDVRNDYESEIGFFEGAEKPPLKTFREFPAYAEKLKEKVDPEKTKVMMYCTGGIRCETFSALLKEKGFKNVFQLQGGVIHYGQQVGQENWRGKLFVFDDRLSVPISDEEPELISKCNFCETKTDVYHNCANMDCNELFLSCPHCAEKLKGCCSLACSESPKRRPFEKKERPKPFRKWYNYTTDKKVPCNECGCTDS